MRFVDRGKSRYLLLIPGWGFDEKVFDDIPLDYSILSFSQNISIEERGVQLEEFLQEKQTASLTLLGWSHGVYKACDLVRYKPHLFNKIFLASARPHYPADEIKNFKKNLLKNRQGTMINFYKRCFSSHEKDHYRTFYRKYFQDYAGRMTLEELLCELDDLSRARLDLVGIPQKKIIFIHGSEDQVAPVKDINIWRRKTGQIHFIAVENVGHMPFLNQSVYETINRS